ncbi:MAG: hypothetical protein CMF23_08245 [Ignavibacteriae bacterium]|nr:hypothetical protein [Ignavibacteriota bacterium]
MSDVNYNYIQYLIIAVYFLFIITKGIRKARNIKDQDDFLVAGRNIGWFLLMASMGATVIGGGASIGSIGKTYEWGIIMVLVTTGWYFQFMFSGKYIAPYFRKAHLYTVAGFFEHRFGKKERFVSFILSLLFSIGVLGAQMVAFGKIINSMIPDISYLTAVILGGMIVIIYSTAGGLLAVIYTDLYQFLILLAGFAITVVMIIPELYESSTQITAALPSDFFTIDGGKGWTFLLSTFAAFLIGETFAPGYVTRFCVGADVKQTQKGIFRAGLILLLIFPIMIFSIGVYAKFFFPDIDPEQALPLTILRLHNPIVSGLIIAALMSAVMSSADSILNSTTAIFTKDFLEQYFVNKLPEKKKLRIARISSVVIGALGVTLALILPDIIDLLLLTYSLWAPGILLPIIVGVFSKDKSSDHTSIVFFTMTAAIFSTIIYMIFDFSDLLQPSVFGVITSVIYYSAGLIYLKLRNSN